MAAPIFENVKAYNLVVPTYNGAGVVVPPGKYVQGYYYLDHQLVVAGELVETDEEVNRLDIVYVWSPDTGVDLTALGITEVIAGQGLAGGGTTPSVTVSLAAGGILAENIADGQVVKSLNGLKDDVVLTEGLNTTITVDEENNTLTIDTNAAAINSATATEPLYLAVVNNVLEGSVVVTVDHDGGAVALQEEPSETQVGTVDVETIKGDTGEFGILQVGLLGLGGTVLGHGNHTLTDYSGVYYACDGTIAEVTIDLPLLNEEFLSGVPYVFVKTDSSDGHSVTLVPAQGQTINGETQLTLTDQYEVARIVSIIDGPTNNFWLIW